MPLHPILGYFLPLGSSPSPSPNQPLPVTPIPQAAPGAAAAAGAEQVSPSRGRSRRDEDDGLPAGVRGLNIVPNPLRSPTDPIRPFNPIRPSWTPAIYCGLHLPPHPLIDPMGHTCHPHPSPCGLCLPPI